MDAPTLIAWSVGGVLAAAGLEEGTTGWLLVRIAARRPAQRRVLAGGARWWWAAGAISAGAGLIVLTGGPASYRPILTAVGSSLVGLAIDCLFAFLLVVGRNMVLSHGSKPRLDRSIGVSSIIIGGGLGAVAAVFLVTSFTQAGVSACSDAEVCLSGVGEGIAGGIPLLFASTIALVYGSRVILRSQKAGE